MKEFPIPFVPALSRKRYAGWSVDRQQEFIRCLAETGSVRHSAKEVGMSERSAFRLRARAGSERFAEAWDLAIGRAGNQLLALAMDRAIDGVTYRTYRDGILVSERKAPSDRLLMWAVDRLLPRTAQSHATAQQMEEAILAIESDEEATSDHEDGLALAEEMGRRGDELYELRQRRLQQAALVHQFLENSDIQMQIERDSQHTA